MTKQQLEEKGGGEGEDEDDDGGDDDEEGDSDCFFESLDRVPSGISIQPDFPSSDDDEDDDDVRISFASAIAPPSEEDQEEVRISFDYGLWMAEPLSVQERRRRLLQGMGLTSGRRPPGHLDRVISQRLSSDTNDNTPPAPAPAPQTETVTPSTVITRCRSDSHLTMMAAPNTTLSRAYSAPPSLLDRGGSPITRPRPNISQSDEACHGETATEEEELMVSSICRIKNLDTGKEFVVSEFGKDGTWGRLNDLQTGLQLTLDEFEKFIGYNPLVKQLMQRSNTGGEANQPFGLKNSKQNGRKKGKWLKNIKFVANSVTGLILEKEKSEIAKSISNMRRLASGGSTNSSSSLSSNSNERLKVHQHGKSCKELTGLYMCQEIKAHEGSIWSMKFSHDGRYLASAGEDRIVIVWEVSQCDTLSSSFKMQQESQSQIKASPLHSLANGLADKQAVRLASQSLNKKKRMGKSSKRSVPDHIVFPESIFSLNEKPICSFHGHLDDVLDLSWSKSQYLLSSSMDKTVRLWDIESKSCLKMFAHNDYVTCVQFNPIDERYFISGSLDAKVRIWSIPDRQVVDWIDLHEMVTATCYTPDGLGALVGSHKGCCCFFTTSDCKLNQKAQVDIRNKKRKSHAKKITGFQFAPGNPSEVLVTSADSQIRVFNGVNMTHKFRGYRNTSSQMSASYTPDGKYILCASEDSHVYIWKRDNNNNNNHHPSSKGWTTTRSHEHFYCKDVSVAIPWPGPIPSLEDNFPSSWAQLPSLPENEIVVDGSSSFPSPLNSTYESGALSSSSFSSSFMSLRRYGNNKSVEGSAWGLVVVTASLAGDVRVYQNFGLPLRLSRQTNLFY